MIEIWAETLNYDDDDDDDDAVVSCGTRAVVVSKQHNGILHSPKDAKTDTSWYVNQAEILSTSHI